MIYDGPEVKVTVAVIEGNAWIAAQYKLDMTKTGNLVDTVNVATQVFQALKNKGVKELFCTAETPSAVKFNEYLGFDLTEFVIHDNHRVMVKEL